MIWCCEDRLMETGDHQVLYFSRWKTFDSSANDCLHSYRLFWGRTSSLVTCFPFYVNTINSTLQAICSFTKTFILFQVRIHKITEVDAEHQHQHPLLPVLTHRRHLTWLTCASHVWPYFQCRQKYSDSDIRSPTWRWGCWPLCSSHPRRPRETRG